MDRDDRDAEAAPALADEEFSDPGLGRGLEAPLGRIGRVFQALVGAMNPDQHLDLLVIGRHVLVGDRPVEPQAVPAVWLEVIGPVAQKMRTNGWSFRRACAPATT